MIWALWLIPSSMQVRAVHAQIEERIVCKIKEALRDVVNARIAEAMQHALQKRAEAQEKLQAQAKAAQDNLQESPDTRMDMPVQVALAYCMFLGYASWVDMHAYMPALVPRYHYC